MYSPRQVLARSVRVSVPSPRHLAPNDGDIARAADALGCELPALFLDFQRALGGRAILGLDVLRLASGTGKSQSLVEQNLVWRSPRHGFALPADVIAFAPDGAGNLFCFDLRTDADEAPVVLWDPSLDIEDNLHDLRPLYASFIDWLEAELDLVVAAA